MNYNKSAARDVEDEAGMTLPQETVNDVNRNVIDELKHGNKRENPGDNDIRLLDSVALDESDLEEQIKNMGENNEQIKSFSDDKLEGFEIQSADLRRRAEEVDSEEEKSKLNSLAHLYDRNADRIRLKFDMRAENEETQALVADETNRNLKSRSKSLKSGQKKMRSEFPVC